MICKNRQTTLFNPIIKQHEYEKPDYKKEIMDSLKEGAIITGVTIGGYMTLKYLFKVSPPSAKLDINECC